jgi:hypothetical protein
MAKYYINMNRAAEIRKSVYGKQMREPIARSAEFMVEYAHNTMERHKKICKEKLDTARTNGEQKLATTKTTALNNIAAIKAPAMSRLSEISTTCGYRISSWSVTEITPTSEYESLMGYHRLTFTRENRT